MKKRKSIVDLWKFVASILIMTYHIYHLDIILADMYWIYVEFFFILTGYFTYHHFQARVEERKDIFEVGVKYTINKFMPFLPYTTVAITLQYILVAHYSLIKTDFYGFISHFFTYPFEVMLLGRVVADKQVLGPVWYLFSMLLVFPLVTFLCQIKNRYLLLVIAGMYSVLYYGRADFRSSTWPNNELRALAGLLLGVFVCILFDMIRETTSNAHAFAVTLIETASMAFAFVVTTMGCVDLKRQVVFAFAIGVGTMMSGKSLTSRFNSRFISYLGLLSLPMFIWHRVVGEIIMRVDHFVPMSLLIRTMLYYSGTIIVSAISYAIVEITKKRGRRV